MGTTFTCTATTPDGEELTFNAEIREDDEVFVYTTNYDRVARILIEGQLASSLGAESLTTACDEPGSTEVGSTFTCTADLPSGDTITIDAQVQEGGEVAVQTTNVLTPENLVDHRVRGGADPRASRSARPCRRRTSTAGPSRSSPRPASRSCAR